MYTFALTSYFTFTIKYFKLETDLNIFVTKDSI